MRKFVPAVIGILLLSACGASSAEQQAGPAGVSAPAATSVAGSDPAADRSAEVARIRALLPEDRPDRVVVMSVPLTKIVERLGVLPAGVMTTRYDLPETLADVPRVGMVTDPDIEKITELQPDLVLGPGTIESSLGKKLAATQLNTAFAPTDSLDDLVHTTLALGDLFDAMPQAEQLVAEADRAREEAVAASAGSSPGKVLLLFGTPDELMMMDEETYAGGIVKALGGGNVSTELATTEAYTPLNLEQVIVADPDTILYLSHGDPKEAEQQILDKANSDPAWAGLRAVKEGRLKALDAALFSYSASITTTPEAFRQMIAALSR